MKKQADRMMNVLDVLSDENLNVLINSRDNAGFKLIKEIRYYDLVLFNTPRKCETSLIEVVANLWMRNVRQKLIYVRDILSRDGYLLIRADYKTMGEIIEIMTEVFSEAYLEKTFALRRTSKCHKKVTKTSEYLLLYKRGVVETHEKESEIVPMTDLFLFDHELEERYNYNNILYCNTVKELLKRFSTKNSKILDCFAGFGATGQAVLELNYEEGGERVFTLISDNEQDICSTKCHPHIKAQSSIYNKLFDYIVLE